LRLINVNFAEMETELDSKLDGMIDKALREPPDYIIPDSFTEELVRKLEKQLAWKELLSEFGLKSGLVLASLGIMTICLIYPAKNDPAPFIQWVANNRFILSGIIGVGIFTFIFDQMVLKYMFKKSGKVL
jgi:hypothetical protein